MKTRILPGVFTVPKFRWFHHVIGRAVATYATIVLGVIFEPVARGQTNGCITPPSGLVGWWRGEGNTLDAAQSNHGVAVGGVTNAPGKVGLGFGFDGTGYIVVPHHPSLNCSNALTIELWYNSAQNNDVYYGIIDKRVGEIGANYGINVAAGAGLGVYYDDLTVQDGDDAASSFEASRYTPAPAPGIFHHLAATYQQVSNNLVQLETYVDGQKVRTRNLAGNLANTINTAPVTIGATAQGAGEYFRGVIDEIGIYNRVLSASEIQSIYAAGDAGKCTGAITNPPPTNASVPVITGFNPAAALVGNLITITGLNFSPVAASNIVYFGATRATVSAASPTSLVVALPLGATYAPISVTVNGQTALSPLAFLPTFVGAGTNISTASFAPGQNLTVADGPIKTVIADVDADGKPDLIVANSYAHNISLLRNISAAGTLDGSSFAPRVDLPVVGGTDSPRCIAVADVDGDGKLDILIGDQATSSVLVYRNISTPGTLNASSFAAPVRFPAAANSYPHGLRVADLNGDGLPEILVANQSGDSISILKNIGSPGNLTTNSFAPQTALITEANPTDIGIGDFNGDGRPDLVTTAFNGSQLSVLRNVATPGAAVSNWFVLDTTLPALAGSLEITVTDLDGDAKLDLVVASVHGYAVSVYRNQATAGAFNTNSFAARVDYSTPGWVHTISVADFNGDAKPDVAAVGELNSYLAVFQNQSTPGNIALASRVDFATGWNAWGIAAGDLDGDNRADIVFANSYDDTLTFYRNLMGQGINTNLTPAGCYNASDSFTTNRNPNGVWSYGFSATLGAPMISFFEPGNWGGLEFWRSNIWYNVPGIYFNPTSETIINPTSTIMLKPGQLALHPGPNGEFAVLRFTVPSDDVYQVVVEFAGADILGTTTDAHLLLNGSPQRDGLVEGFGPDSSWSINANMFLRAGDQLDVAVGRGANQEFTYDATAVAVQICAGTNAPGSCTPSPSGLAGWWRGDGDWRDAVGGHDAVPQFSAGFASGQVGNSFNFDGADQVAQVANAPALNPTNALTLEAWIYINDFSANDGVALFGKDGVYSERQYMVGIADLSRSGKTNVPNTWIVRAHLSVPTEFHYFDGTTVLEKQKWYHVAMTYDGAALRLYVNGVLDRSEPLTGPIIVTGQPLVIGGSVPGPWDFNGRVDELSLYHRALSANEIGAIFAAGAAGKCAPPEFAPRITAQPQSLVANASDTVQFNVAAVGLPQPNFQWYFANAPLFGQTNAAVQLTNVQPSQAGDYQVVVANSYGAVTSAVATLTVMAYPPVITRQPTNLTVIESTAASFSVQATGSVTLAYQWLFNGQPLAGRTTTTLALTGVQSNNAGDYAVIVTNLYGAATSSVATLTVTPRPPCVAVHDGLVSWWSGENSPIDAWGSNNGTAFSFQYANGKVGRAFVNPLVAVEDAASLRVTNALTIEAWVNPSAVSSARVILAKHEYPGTQPNGVQSAYLLGLTNNGALFFVLTPNGSVRTNSTLVTTNLLPLNLWSHVAATYDGFVMRLYLNGTQIGQRNHTNGIFPGSAPLGIGGFPLGTSSPWQFSGLMDEVTLYNRALSATEIQSIFAADLTGKCLAPPVVLQSPQTQAVPFGEDVKLTANIQGSRPLVYQWYFSGPANQFTTQRLFGATNASLLVEKIQTNNTGNYSLRVTNGAGFAVSAPAQISLLPAPACTEMLSGLVSWWSGNSNTFDAVGLNNIATFTTAAYATGKVGAAFSLNGLSSRLVINDSASLNFSSNANFSIEMWIRTGMSNTSGGSIIYPNVPLLEKRTTPTSGWVGYSLSLNQGRLAFAMGSGGVFAPAVVSNYISSGSDLRDLMFHHVAVTVNRSATNGGVLYVDGVPVLTFNPRLHNVSLVNTSPLFIGAPTITTSNAYFAGLIDEPAIYNRELTATEILSIRNAGAAGRCKAAPLIITQPVGKFVTNGGSATLLVQASGTPLPRYLWRRNTAPIAGATNASLVLSNLTLATAGTYSVIVSNAFGSVTSSNAVVIIDQLPIANPDSVTTPSNTPAVFPAAKLILNDTDADGDVLTVTAVSPNSGQNGTVSLVAGTVTYTPPSNFVGNDTFTYLLMDNPGATAVGTVMVTVGYGGAAPMNIVAGPLVDNGQFVVRFAGIPGLTYTIETSTTLNAGWTKATNLTAPETDTGLGIGVFEFREPATSDGARYYRTVYPAY